MAGENVVEQVRQDMAVFSSDGKRLGTVKELHTRGGVELWMEVLPRMPLWQLIPPKNLFLPASAVAEVTGKHVRLNRDAKAAETCTHAPRWISTDLEARRWAGLVGGG